MLAKDNGYIFIKQGNTVKVESDVELDNEMYATIEEEHESTGFIVECNECGRDFYTEDEDTICSVCKESKT